jgi:hypothetical protein
MSQGALRVGSRTRPRATPSVKALMGSSYVGACVGMTESQKKNDLSTIRKKYKIIEKK